jgi:hypothetical protein
VSCEDCILYRKIGDDWCVAGYGFTFLEAEMEDAEFRQVSTVVAFDELFDYLQRLDAKHVTEWGICYAGDYQDEVPPEVPEEHRLICCIPASERERGG